MMPASVLITCEHAGNTVPPAYEALFGNQKEMLQSHQGWDPGAIQIANYLSDVLNAPLFQNDITRLLIEVNRSPDHPQLLSMISSSVNSDEKEKLMVDIYRHYRNAVEGHIRKMRLPVLHLSIHTFTPVWEGAARDLEVGILYDPGRVFEESTARELHDKLSERLPGWRIKFNEPYKGTDDGFTTFLRTAFADNIYAGIEIEANQALLANDSVDQLKIAIGVVIAGMLFKAR